MSAASTHKLSVQVLDFEDIGLLIQLARLICDFCSSDQRFACGFLQIPPHDGHPCRPANDSPCRVRRRLSLPSECALPGAPNKNAAGVSLPRRLRRARHALPLRSSRVLPVEFCPQPAEIRIKRDEAAGTLKERPAAGVVRHAIQRTLAVAGRKVTVAG